MRGGEKMLESLLELFPDADIYTHVLNKKAVSPLINSHRIITSSISKLPFAKSFYQKYMPLMPAALLEFDLQNYDLIISSEAGPAKGVVPNPNAYHLCYCHSPARYLWDMYHEYGKKASPFTRIFMRLLTPKLRVWDVVSANLVDRFVTNSNWTAKRIKRYYNRDADVVFGPVDIEKYICEPRSPEDFYLYAGQITEYKRADIAIDACVALGKKLIVAGSGMSKKEMRHYEKSSLVTFLGRVSDDELKKLFSNARALLFPGVEDLGLIPIEANAAGCPVIAFRGGGALDTIKENVTGMFFDEQNAASLQRAITRFEHFEQVESQFNNRDLFTAQVRQFSKEAFQERIKAIIEEKKRV
jgi:glycosyltransferase involved in cell wall biosynthesis